VWSKEEVFHRRRKDKGGGWDNAHSSGEKASLRRGGAGGVKKEKEVEGVKVIFVCVGKGRERGGIGLVVRDENGVSGKGREARREETTTT